MYIWQITARKKKWKLLGMSTIGIKKIENYPIEIVFLWHIKNINSDLDNKTGKKYTGFTS